MKKLCAVIVFLFLVTMSSCTVTFERGAAGQNETGVIGSQTDPVNAHIMLLGSYADSYGGAYVEDGKHYLLVTCDPDSMGETAASIRGQGYILNRVTFSYAELKSACEDINVRFASEEVPEELRQAVTSWAIHQKNNCILISVVSENNIEDAMQEFLRCDPQMIVIEYRQRKPEAL